MVSSVNSHTTAEGSLALAPLPTIKMMSADPTPSLRLRRLAAWLAEAGLITISGLVPFGLGWAALRTPMTTVPLNPLLVAVQHHTADALQLPKSRLRSTVPPLTNLLWTIGVLAPLGVSAWQLQRLRRTGQTWPKVWLQLRVVPHQGAVAPGLSLGWSTVLRRESVRWGLPLALTYGVGLASGVSLGLWLPVVAGMGYLGLGLTGLRDRIPWHDRLAGTRVLGTGANDIRQTYQVTPDDMFDPAPLALRPRFTQPRLYGSEAASTAEDPPMTMHDEASGLSSIVLSPLDPDPEPAISTAIPTSDRWRPLRPLSLVGLGGWWWVVSGAPKRISKPRLTSSWGTGPPINSFWLPFRP